MRPPEGTIICVHACTLSSRYNLLTPAWGLVILKTESRFTLARMLADFDQPPFHGSWHNGAGRGWEFDDNEFTVPDQDDVPDEVWGALAQWRLTQ